MKHDTNVCTTYDYQLLIASESLFIVLSSLVTTTIQKIIPDSSKPNSLFS